MYAITNENDIYIRINKGGQPITCNENRKDTFEYSKACNICNNLPKHLRVFNFYVKEIPEEKPKQTEEKFVVNPEPYEIPDTVSRWIDKFASCDDVIKEAKVRKDELNSLLSNVDKEFSNIIHKIELEKSKDLYHGWLLYKEIKANRKKRREIKDELVIISNVLAEKVTDFSSEKVKKSVDGLSTRKFRIRVVEEGE